MNDLESLRYSGNKKNLISKEQYIKNADVIICHNQRMKEFLIENKIDGEKIVVLGILIIYWIILIKKKHLLIKQL